MLTLLSLVRERRFDEPFEKRVGLVRLALEFRMILAGEKVGVIAQLDELGEGTVR